MPLDLNFTCLPVACVHTCCQDTCQLRQPRVALRCQACTGVLLAAQRRANQDVNTIHSIRMLCQTIRLMIQHTAQFSGKEVCDAH